MIVIGGGDTGRRLHRHLAAPRLQERRQFRTARPPARRAGRRTIPGPNGRAIYRVDYSHAEVEAKIRRRPARLRHADQGVRRRRTASVTGVKTVQRRLVASRPKTARPGPKSPAARKIWPADLVLLATGFLGPGTDRRRNAGPRNRRARAATGKPSPPSTASSPPTCEGVFAAGDCRRGQSLVVWAINEGRGAARAIDEFLMGHSKLPAPGITLGRNAGLK